MAESIFVRVRRILSARVQDSVDAMEAAANDAVMREAMREVDRLIDETRARQDTAQTRRLQAKRQCDLIDKKLDDLTDKATFALSQGREDLAENALTRQVDLEAEMERLEETQSLARIEEEKLEETMAALRARHREMEEALKAFEIARSEANMGGDKGIALEIATERKVEKSQEAFNRAMQSGGGNGFTPGDAAAINGVAEIDTLQKRATVADRLAMLKSKQASAA